MGILKNNSKHKILYRRRISDDLAYLPNHLFVIEFFENVKINLSDDYKTTITIYHRNNGFSKISGYTTNNSIFFLKYNENYHRYRSNAQSNRGISIVQGLSPEGCILF